MIKIFEPFSCKVNPDIENFLKEKSSLFEKKHKSRTYLLINADNKKNLEIIAYYSIALKAIDLSSELPRKTKQELDGLYTRLKVLAVYLIGQLGRSDRYSGKDISGREILEYAESTIFQSHDIIGGRIIFLECDNDKLVKFYENNGYEYLQDGDNGYKQLRKVIC